jgi:hypothetical protein
MPPVKKSSVVLAAASVLGASLVPVGTAFADTASGQFIKVSAAINEQVKTEQAAKASQEEISGMDDDSTSMLAEYRQALAEMQSLKAYDDQLAKQVGSQNGEIGSINKQLDEIDTTSREVLPLMNNMLSTLDQFVKLDVPFLPDERAKRIASLKDMMDRADVSLSEKYRRIVEAYQIELEYGRTLESYNGKVGDKTVDFLRVGRVALLYQTLDGSETGYWDADAKTWKVDDGYNGVVRSGLKVAKKQSAPDFLIVPVHAPTEVN